MKITEERKAVYLETLREVGSHREACRAASPHLDSSERVGEGSFRRLRQYDPAFEMECVEALNDFLGKAEALVAERAFAPEVRRHYDRNGNLLGEDVSFRESNRLLTRLLAKHDPSWQESRKVDSTLQISGGVTHEHLQLKMQDLSLLEPTEQTQLLQLLEKIQDARKLELPAAAFEEVDSE